MTHVFFCPPPLVCQPQNVFHLGMLYSLLGQIDLKNIVKLRHMSVPNPQTFWSEEGGGWLGWEIGRGPSKVSDRTRSVHPTPFHPKLNFDRLRGWVKILPLVMILFFVFMIYVMDPQGDGSFRAIYFYLCQQLLASLVKIFHTLTHKLQILTIWFFECNVGGPKPHPIILNLQSIWSNLFRSSAQK